MDTEVLGYALVDLEESLAELPAERARLDAKEATIREAIKSLTALIAYEEESADSPVLPAPEPVVTQPQLETAPKKASRRQLAKEPVKASTPKKVYSDDVKRQAFRLLAEGKSQAEAARTLEIPYYTLYDWVARAKSGIGEFKKLKEEAAVEPWPAEKAEPMHLVTEPQPLRSKSVTVEKGHIVPTEEANRVIAENERQGREASARMKEFRTAARTNERLAACGKCVTRIVNDTPFFAAQPDCPEHGTGLGTAQPGRERKPDPLSLVS